MVRSTSITTVPPEPPLYPEFYSDWIRNTNSARNFLPLPDLEDVLQSAHEQKDRNEAEIYKNPSFFEQWKIYLNDHKASPNTLKNLEKLQNKDAVAVITGQQPCVLCSPAYFLYKVITACVTAEVLTDRGLSAVPVFWNHSDDHDHSDIDRTHLITRNNTLESISYELDYSSKQPISDLEIPEKTQSVLDQTEKFLRDTEFTPDLLELLRTTSSKWPASWCTTLLLELFQEEGLLVFEPKLARPCWASVLKEHLKNWKRDRRLIRKKGTELEHHQYPESLNTPDRPDLFFLQNRQRNAVRITNEQPLEHWLEKLDNFPGHFSPGVSLRPLVQDAFFPVACTISGPNEICYQAQLTPLYDAHNIHRPPVLPRLNMTLVEGKIQNVIEKFDLDPRNAFNWPEQLETLIQKQIPDSVDNSFQNTRSRIQDALNELKETTQKLDSNLTTPWEKTRDNIMRYLDRFRENVERSARQQQEIGQNQIQKLQTNLFPEDRLQERMISLWHYFSLYSLELQDLITSRARDFVQSPPYNHQFVEIS